VCWTRCSEWHYGCFLQVDGHTEVIASLNETFTQVLQVHLRVSNWGSVIGVQQFTNQYTLLVLIVARSQERLNSLPVLRVWSMIPSSCGKACARTAEKNKPNNVGARMQPCLTPLQVGKVLDMEPSNWTLAFMFSWNATRMESSVWGQPNSLSMLYKLDRLTLSKALVRTMKTTYSGRDCSMLFFGAVSVKIPYLMCF